MKPQRIDEITLLGISSISLAAIAAALVSQHVFGMLPCVWCVFQRLVFLLISVACVCGLRWPRTGLSLCLTLSVCGIASAIAQHQAAGAAVSCSLTLADRVISGLQLDVLAAPVFAPQAMCADAAVNLLGIPYEFWSLMLFASFAFDSSWRLLGLWRRAH